MLEKKSFSRRVFVTAGLGGVTSFLLPKRSFGEELDNALTIRTVDANSISVIGQGESSIISISDNDVFRVVSIKDVETGEVHTLELDKQSNTIYSSITNEICELDAGYVSNQKPGYAPLSVTRKSTKYVSYAQIASVVGIGATAAQIIGAILIYVPGAYNIGAAAEYIGRMVSEMAGMAGITPYYQNHGIKLIVATTKYYRRKSHVPWRTDVSIVGASLY